jgi:hypothetical protein
MTNGLVAQQVPVQRLEDDLVVSRDLSAGQRQQAPNFRRFAHVMHLRRGGAPAQGRRR